MAKELSRAERSAGSTHCLGDLRALFDRAAALHRLGAGQAWDGGASRGSDSPSGAHVLLAGEAEAEGRSQGRTQEQLNGLIYRAPLMRNFQVPSSLPSSFMNGSGVPRATRRTRSNHTAVAQRGELLRDLVPQAAALTTHQ